MPKGPQGQKRPADTVANAIRVAQILTGEIEEGEASPAQRRSRKAGARGGPARAQSLTPEQRSEIARVAASARWKKKS